MSNIPDYLIPASQAVDEPGVFVWGFSYGRSVETIEEMTYAGEGGVFDTYKADFIQGAKRGTLGFRENLNYPNPYDLRQFLKEVEQRLTLDNLRVEAHGYAVEVARYKMLY